MKQTALLQEEDKTMEHPTPPTIPGMQTHGTPSEEIALDHQPHMEDNFIDENWEPPGVLETPPARDGFVQRWVRVGYGDEALANIRKRTNEGWRPRNLDSLPAQSFVPPIQERGRFTDSLVVQDMCLMEMPKQRNENRKAHYVKKTTQVTQAINHDLDRASKAGGTLIDNQSKSEVSGGQS